LISILDVSVSDRNRATRWGLGAKNKFYEEEILMKKATCVILGIAFIALGILGLTGLITMSDTVNIYVYYVYIGEIVIGVLGLAVGVYTQQSVVKLNLRTDASVQEKGIDQQGIEIDRQGKEIDQQRKEIDQQRIEIDHQKEEHVRQKK
jgi:uncharacterized membrane protein YqjE